MTETPTADFAEAKVIDEALELIDGALGTLMNRELVSSGEVTDVLLDVRSKLRSQPGDELSSKDDSGDTGRANSSSSTPPA